MRNSDPSPKPLFPEPLGSFDIYRIPTVVPWRPLLKGEEPARCACVTPLVTGHTPDCHLAPRWAWFRHMLTTKTTQAIGAHWATLASMAFSLGAAEMAREIGGDLAFLVTFATALLGCHALGVIWPELQRWQRARLHADLMHEQEAMRTLSMKLPRFVAMVGSTADGFNRYEEKPVDASPAAQ